MKDQWDRTIPYHKSKLDEAKLSAVDKLIGTCGVEYVRFECKDSDDYGDGAGFSYCNNGDTYAATLVLYKGRFIVSSWGDMVEKHERRCSKCLKRSREEMNQ